MDSPAKYKSSLAFTDLLFNILVGFVFLFVVAFLLINPRAKTGDIVVPAQFLITLTWPDLTAHDMDLWVQDPTGNSVGFTRKDQGIMNLDRDDLGRANDQISVDGQNLTVNLNQEVVSLRGTVPGEYLVSVHWYRKSFSDNEEEKPVPATVVVTRINPYAVIYKQTIVFRAEGEMHNYYAFTVDQFNNVSNIRQTDQSAVVIMQSQRP
jgi:uncharacterized membrane protein